MRIKIILPMVLLMASVMNMSARPDDDQREAKPLEQLLVYENPHIYMSFGDITYKPKDALGQVKNSVVGAIAGSELPIEDETLVPLAKSSLKTGATKAFRIQALAGAPTEAQKKSGACLRFTAIISGCNTTIMLRDHIQDKRILITASIYLTNMNTGEIVASQAVSGQSWAGLFTTFQEAKEWAAHDLMVNVWNQMNSWYPLRGHMLEKGLMKGEKQKLKEIYIDLGSKNNLGKGFDVNVYTVKRIAGRIARKYIGRGKVAEILGDDISSVKLKKGADDIKEAFDNGAEIAISVY